MKDCPNINAHTKCPDGFISRQLWVFGMIQHSYQIKCKGCGLWAIWRRKKPVNPIGRV